MPVYCEDIAEGINWLSYSFDPEFPDGLAEGEKSGCRPMLVSLVMLDPVFVLAPPSCGFDVAIDLDTRLPRSLVAFLLRSGCFGSMVQTVHTSSIMDRLDHLLEDLISLSLYTSPLGSDRTIQNDAIFHKGRPFPVISSVLSLSHAALSAPRNESTSAVTILLSYSWLQVRGIATVTTLQQISSVPEY